MAWFAVALLGSIAWVARAQAEGRRPGCIHASSTPARDKDGRESQVENAAD